MAARAGFPRDIDGLRALPGIGPYTAAAIGAIAFGLPAVPVDGNVERVAARLFAIETPLPAAKPAIQAGGCAAGADAAARARPSDFAQALFDLGATICTADPPACALCPWMQPCAARQSGIAAELPRKAAKASGRCGYGAHFWLTDAQGPGAAAPPPAERAAGRHDRTAGHGMARRSHGSGGGVGGRRRWSAAWREIGEIRHGFTHFELRISVFSATVPVIAAEGFLQNATQLESEALPSVMRKCVALARKAG